MGLKSFSEVIQFLRNNYLDTPEAAPVEVLDRKRDLYFDSYPNEFREATQMCLGVTVPEEFDAVFEEIINELIGQKEAAPEEMMILQCSRCNYVWDYRGKHVEIRNIHCPACGASASKNWLRELNPQPIL